MTFKDELKRAQQVPFAELYEIRKGGYVSRYTSYSEDVTYNDNTYIAAQIQRGTFSKDTQLKSVRITVTAPLTGENVAYVANTPVQPVKIKIYRMFLTSPPLIALLFDGRAINFIPSKGKLEMPCESASLVFRGQALKVVHKAYCNNLLFDPWCGLDSEDWKVTIPAVTVSGKTLVSSVFADYADKWFTQGRIKNANGDQRLVTNHVGNTVTLQAEFDTSVVTGSTVYAWPGCDKTAATCQGKFDNFLPHFRGFPYIPSNNPVFWGV